MNVVGKFGSLITQGVHTVASPFHPFGGAIDIIVVQQPDGSFRSTPWYVRFGKFQGVLKGAEKYVNINVNGIDANFHMYLDNAGQAYFIREVGSGKNDYEGVRVINEEGSIDRSDNVNNSVTEVCRIEHSVSDSGVDQLREERVSLGAMQLQRAESDADCRYYEFQDEFSFNNSMECSEFESKICDNLDGDRPSKPLGSDSEVVLVSVDGHVLTAPVSVPEQNTDNIKLDTPQIHLDPVKQNEEFMLDESLLNLESNNVCAHQIEVCEGDGEHVHQYQDPQNSSRPNNDVPIQNDLDETYAWIKNSDVYGSCVELSELAEQVVNADNQMTTSPERVKESHNIPFCSIEVISPNEKEGLVVLTNESIFPPYFSASNENEVLVEITTESLSPSHISTPNKSEGMVELTKESSSPLHSSDPNDNEGLVEFSNESSSIPYMLDSDETTSLVELATKSVSPLDDVNANAVDESLTTVIEGIEETAVEIEHAASDNNIHDHIGIIEEVVPGDKVLSTSASSDLNSSLQGLVSEDRSSKNGIMEVQLDTLIEEMQAKTSSGFEVSLCGKELRAGVGLEVAAKVFEAYRVSIEEFRDSAKSILKDENLVIRYKEIYLPWEKASPIVLGKVAFGLDLQVEPKDAILVEQSESLKLRDDDAMVTPTSSSGRKWRLWPIPFRRVKTLEHSNSNSSSEELFLDTESGMQSLNPESPSKQFILTNVPSNDQLVSLNLNEGQNTIIFSFSTRVLGTQQVEAHIYLWNWNARIVISDVDGTITKSDVLGQFMPLVGKDWSQSGVANLYSAIKENGYQLLFLSARAIVQSHLTKTFLFNLKQDGKTLPTGPVVISPDGLFPSLYREVIRRTPHEFKISCLEDIRRVFPADHNPFYAGFGNRDTDELSYRKMGIPKGKIFIINPRGEVATSHCIDVKSYTSLHTLVNDMFPPTSLVEQEDFNSWNFWRMPLPEIDGL